MMEEVNGDKMPQWDTDCPKRYQVGCLASSDDHREEETQCEEANDGLKVQEQNNSPAPHALPDVLTQEDSPVDETSYSREVSTVETESRCVKVVGDRGGFEVDCHHAEEISRGDLEIFSCHHHQRYQRHHRFLRSALPSRLEDADSQPFFRSFWRLHDPHLPHYRK